MTAWFLPLLPLTGAALLLGASRLGDRRTPALLGAIAVATMAVTLLAGLWAARAIPSAEWPLWGPHLRPRLVVEGLGRVMVILVPAVAAPVALYAASYMRRDPGLARLLALLLAFVGAMQLLVTAGDFLTLLVGWELVGACSWALIGHEWRDPARPRAALDAFITTRAGDLGLYLAAAAAVAASGSVRFEALTAAHGPLLHVIAAGVVFAAAAKSAQLPFSPWLFSAMAGPTPSSALLHSATMVAAGAYVLARLGPVLAPVSWFGPTVIGLGLATALAGSVVASLQADLKRALAASTSAQYGLMLVAIGVAVPGAAGVHLVTHAFFKALLFLGGGVAIHAVAGTGDLRTMRQRQLGGVLPGTAILFGIGALALAAVPPLGGAYSKEAILAAAAERGLWLALGVLAASVLSALYAGRLYVLAFGWGRGTPGDAGNIPRTSIPEVTAMAFLALASIALSLLWLPGANAFIERIAGARLAAGEPWAFAASLGALGVAASLVWILVRRNALVTLGLPERWRESLAAWLGIPRAAHALVVSPVLALARRLAEFDDRVIDAGVRAAVSLARLASRGFAWWGERSMGGLVTAVARAAAATGRGSSTVDDRALDGVVTAVAWATSASGRVSRTADDRGIDAAVEGVARQVGVVGAQSRRLQTGLAHHYYVIVAVGALVGALAAALGRIRW